MKEMMHYAMHKRSPTASWYLQTMCRPTLIL